METLSLYSSLMSYDYVDEVAFIANPSMLLRRHINILSRRRDLMEGAHFSAAHCQDH